MCPKQKNNNNKNFPQYEKLQTIILRRGEWGCEGEERSNRERCSVNEVRSHLIKIVDLLIKCIPYTENFNSRDTVCFQINH